MTNKLFLIKIHRLIGYGYIIIETSFPLIRFIGQFSSCCVVVSYARVRLSAHASCARFLRICLVREINGHRWIVERWKHKSKSPTIGPTNHWASCETKTRIVLLTVSLYSRRFFSSCHHHRSTFDRSRSLSSRLLHSRLASHEQRRYTQRCRNLSCFATRCLSSLRIFSPLSFVIPSHPPSIVTYNSIFILCPDVLLPNVTQIILLRT